MTIPPWISELNPDQRIECAKHKVERAFEHLQVLLLLHENSAIVVYSPMLSSQVGRSYAANAFNMLQGAVHGFEIVRLCALWERTGRDRESIPTIVDLIDDAEIIPMLAKSQRYLDLIKPRWHSGSLSHKPATFSNHHN
jgi:hypothetical protein